MFHLISYIPANYRLFDFSPESWSVQLSVPYYRDHGRHVYLRSWRGFCFLGFLHVFRAKSTERCFKGFNIYWLGDVVYRRKVSTDLVGFVRINLGVCCNQLSKDFRILRVIPEYRKNGFKYLKIMLSKLGKYGFLYIFLGHFNPNVTCTFQCNELHLCIHKTSQ